MKGSNTDFLLCALSDRYQMPIFTTDEDFQLFKEHISIGLQINVLKIQQARCLHYLHFSAKHYLNLYISFHTPRMFDPPDEIVE